MTPEKTPGQDAVRAHLRTAIDAATRSAPEGGGPFGAVLVTADGQEFIAVNRVTAENDPTAHAEISVIRAAAAALGARLARGYCAAERHDAAQGGFDDAAFHDFFTASREQRDAMLPVEHKSVENCTEPFEAWKANPDRTDY